MSKYRSPEFLKIQKEWYDKLKDNGFEDTEEYNEEIGSDGISFLKRSSKCFARRYNDSTFSRYQLYRSFLVNGDFLSFLDRKIWGMYADGQSLRDIATNLNKESNGDLDYSHFWVLTQIRRIKIDVYKWARESGYFEDEE